MARKPPKQVAAVYVDGQLLERIMEVQPVLRRARPPRNELDPKKLISAKLKVKRAKKHIQELHSVIKVFNERSPYELVADVDAQNGEQVYRLRIKEPIPIEISAILGDIVHNMRAALDVLMCDFIRSHSGGKAGHGGYPIGTIKKAKSSAKGKVKGISPATERVLRKLQANSALQTVLGAIHALDVLDKHNRIVVTETATTQVTAGVAIPGIFFGPDNTLRIGNPGPDGMPLPMVQGVPAGFKPIFPATDNVEVYRAKIGFHHNVKCTLHVAFGEGQVLEGEPVLETLQQYADLIDRVVLIYERYAN